MTDQTIIGLVTAAGGLLATCFTGFMAYKMAQLKNNQDLAAIQAQKVVEKLEDTTIATDVKLAAIGEKQYKMAQVNDATHALVNSNYGVQLRLYATSCQRIAILTGDPSDLAMADEAMKAWRTHQETQARMDTAPAPPAYRPPPVPAPVRRVAPLAPLAPAPAPEPMQMEVPVAATAVSVPVETLNPEQLQEIIKTLRAELAKK